MYFEDSRDSQGDYEQRLAALRRGDLSESLYVDMRGSTRSMGTFKSAGNTSQVAEGRRDGDLERVRRELDPYSHLLSTSPPVDSRITQSADNTLFDDRLSPTSLPGIGSPRFQPDSHPTFVSDYVAFGRARPVPDSPSHSDPPKSSLPGHRADFIPQFAREQERLTANLQTAHSQIVSLENHKTEALIRIQGLERDKKSLEERCRSLAREALEAKKVEKVVGDWSSFQSRLEAFEAGKEEFIREIATLRHENSQKQSKIDDLSREERRARDQLSQKAEECHSLKKERLRLLKDLDEFQHFKANLERDLKGNAAEREKLRAKCKELELALQMREEQEGLSRVVEELKAEIADKDRKLRDVEGKSRENERRGRSEGRKQPGYRGNREESAENRGKSPHCQRLLREIMSLVGAEHRKELLPKLKSLIPRAKLAEKLTFLVIQHSPPHTFTVPPSVPQLEAWLDRLITEYLALRKGSEGVLGAVAGRLAVGRGAVLQAVERLLAENADLRSRRASYL